MGREYERLFGALPRLTPPVYLCERVLAAVSRERIRLVRMRLVFSSCTGLLSLFGAVFAVRGLIHAMTATGFSSYASLLVSDGTTVVQSHSFLLSLLESLPGTETMLTLAVLAVLIESLRVMVAALIEWKWQPAAFA